MTVDVPSTPATEFWPARAGTSPRGTVVVLAGRGDRARVYDRFGRRLAADGYQVWAFDDVTDDSEAAAIRIEALLADDALAGPGVLIGSGSGALFAAGLAARRVPGLAGLVLAGLPVGQHLADRLPDWEEDVTATAAHPTYRRVLTGTDVIGAGGTQADEICTKAIGITNISRITVPTLAIHGTADQVSEWRVARRHYATIPRVEIVGIVGGRHDILNDISHRTVAATVVLFLERLRHGVDAPQIACLEPRDEREV